MFSARSLVSCSNCSLKTFRFGNIQSKTLLLNKSFINTTVAPLPQHRTLFNRTELGEEKTYINPKQKISLFKNSSVKNYNNLYQLRRLFSKTQTEEEKIYIGNLASRVRAVKIFSLTTSITGLAAQPMIIELAGKLGGTGVIVAICGFFGFFTFVTPLLLHIITKKYVTEMHYNPETEEYTATTVSLLLTNIKTKFKPSDVVVPDVPGMFTSFIVGKRSLFVEPTLFSDPEHYVKIMGYDKPMDFKLNLSEPTSIPKKDEPKKELE